MDTSRKPTSRDLELMPENGKLYEVIGGELYVSRPPSWEHQYTCVQIASALNAWSKQTGLGSTNAAPGLIFAEDDDVAPDVVWISRQNLATALEADRKLHAAPELIVEVLSPGLANQQRDRQTKLKLYSRRAVQEYWVVDCERRQIEIYRRDQGTLALEATLLAQDTLASQLLPGFSCPVADLFFQIPPPSKG